ncbi:MAG: hypothetical protein V2B19_02325 [Pseudomonadota bacterium]
MIQYSEFESALKLGKDACIERVKEDIERYSLDDIHAAMSGWACFNIKPKTFSPSTDENNDYFHVNSGQPSSKSQKNKDKANKKKRKQAKASKKKNRR